MYTKNDFQLPERNKILLSVPTTASRYDFDHFAISTETGVMKYK